MGEGRIPYHGYVEVKIEIPEITAFKEDVLMMVIDDDEYGKGVPIQVGTLHIYDIIARVTPEESALLGKAWDRAMISSYMGEGLSDVRRESISLLIR